MNILVFLGSARNSTPPRPARLGERVTRAIINSLHHYDDIQVTLVDPLDYPLEPVFKPHFAYARSQVPDKLDALAEQIRAAEGYVMVSPEYNHSMRPALCHLLNHFGSSLFSFKPSAIATYSAGQWGGARAAVGMRTFLGELGCLPVSAMIHVPHAQTLLSEDGEFSDSEQQEHWQGYFSRTLNQLLWWAEAASAQQIVQPSDAISKAFTRSPAQRNAPDA